MFTLCWSELKNIKHTLCIWDSATTTGNRAPPNKCCKDKHTSEPLPEYNLFLSFVFSDEQWFALTSWDNINTSAIYTKVMSPGHIPHHSNQKSFRLLKEMLWDFCPGWGGGGGGGGGGICLRRCFTRTQQSQNINVWFGAGPCLPPSSSRVWDMNMRAGHPHSLVHTHPHFRKHMGMLFSSLSFNQNIFTRVGQMTTCLFCELQQEAWADVL